MRTALRVALGGLAAVLGAANGANAQNSVDASMAYPAPPPVNGAPGSYAVAPAMPGSGGNYSYVQQNLGAGMGMSPNAYYSGNFFTSTPMTPTYNYAAPGVSTGTPGYSYPAGAYANPGAVTYPSQPTTATTYQTTTYQPATATTYGAANTGTTYAQANSTYYATRRGGPLRRVFGRR